MSPNKFTNVSQDDFGLQVLLLDSGCANSGAGYYYVNLTQTRVIKEEGTSTEKMPQDWLPGKPVGYFLY